MRQGSQSGSRGIRWVAVAVLVMGALCLSCRPKADTPFEQENAKLLAGNPAGLTFKLEVEGGQDSFHIYEPILVDFSIKSSKDQAYSIELLEGMNSVGSHYDYQFDQKQGVLGDGKTEEGRSFICCNRNRPYLTSRPTPLRRYLTDTIRFIEPGQYEIYVTTRRVFRGTGSSLKDPYNTPSDFILTSNIVSLTILADDPSWDTEQLKTVAGILDSPRAKAFYEREEQRIRSEENTYGSQVPPPDLFDHSGYARALRELEMLDSPDGIEDRIRRQEKYALEEWHRNGVNGGFSIGPFLFRTTRPDLAVSTITEMVKKPDFAVGEALVWDWAEDLVQRDYPDLSEKLREDGASRQMANEYYEHKAKAQRDILAELEAVVPSKSGTAREMTANSIRTLKDDITHWQKAKVAHTIVN